MPPGDAAEAFDALGDEQRRRIVELLGAGPRSVGEIADDLPISRPAVSRHLRRLGEAGLVEHHSVGTRNVYELRREGVEVLQAYLASVWGEAFARYRLVTENTEPRHE